MIQVVLANARDLTQVIGDCGDEPIATHLVRPVAANGIARDYNERGEETFRARTRPILAFPLGGLSCYLDNKLLKIRAFLTAAGLAGSEFTAYKKEAVRPHYPLIQLKAFIVQSRRKASRE
jgi:hypothetical protein